MLQFSQKKKKYISFAKVHIIVKHKTVKTQDHYYIHFTIKTF